MTTTEQNDLLPATPNPNLDAKSTVAVVCAGLEFNDFPHADAGMERLFEFLTPQGRVAVAPPPPKKGTQGGVTLDFFLEKAGSPAIGALLECSGFALVGEPTITPATMAHGSLATQMVEVLNEAEDLAIHSALCADPAKLEAIRLAVSTDSPLPEVSSSDVPRKTRFLLMLEQQRRPPHLDCWLIKELHSMQRSKLQILNQGGEEFEGADPEDD